VSAEGGADRRWAGYVAGGTVVLIVVAFGDAIGHIPEAVIGGLLLVIGVDLVVGRLPDARLAWRAGTAPRVLLIVTFVLTLAVPLQWAIMGGAVLSLLAYVGASSRAARLQRIVRDDQGWMLADEVPATLPPGEPVLLRYSGHPERRDRALEFQQVVDKLFSFGGARGDTEESPIGLARRFRELAGFSDDEVDRIAQMDHDALEERKAAVRVAREAAGADATAAG